MLIENTLKWEAGMNKEENYVNLIPFQELNIGVDEENWDADHVIRVSVMVQYPLRPKP